jgi:hypothetical protein
MEQVNIYEYFGIETDPLFQRIQQLKKGDYIHLEQAVIIINPFGIYEILTEDEHESGTTDPFKCYEKVVSMLKMDQPLDELATE